MTRTAPLDPTAVLVRPAGHLAQQWELRLPAGVPYADIFRPETWAEIERFMRRRGGGKRPARDDLIRIIGAGFDVQCVVVSVSDGYSLEYYAGKRPSSVAQVLADLDALPQTGSSADLRSHAAILRKRWAAAGITREDIGAARRTFAKDHHPDTGATSGQRLAAANAILDAALTSLPEAA